MIKEILDVRTGKREQVGGSGGSTELKLVATGTYDEEKTTETSEAFNLDNKLEMNKFYLLEYYNDDSGHKRSTYFVTRGDIQDFGTHIAEDIFVKFSGTFSLQNENYEEVLGIIFYTYSYTTISGVLDNSLNIGSFNGNIASSESDYVKVYELPFTLGGAE